MLERVDINFININYKYYYDKKYNTVIIQINNDYNIITLTNNYYIRYDIDEQIINKKYFIEVNEIDININTLETKNFILNMPKDMYYIYTYYDNEPNKSIIFFNNQNYFPLIFMGLPNLRCPLEVNINYTYNELSENLSLVSISGNQTSMLFNNYEGNYNYLQNTIVFNGLVYKISIPDNGGITDDNPENTYKLFQIDNTIYLDIGTNIYFYNESNLFSYILYLNNYNYVDYKTYPENYESIILAIDYIDTSGNIYSVMESSGNNYISGSSGNYNLDEFENINSTSSYNTIFYTYDTSGNKIEVNLNLNVPVVYSSVLSLDLQTFNSKQLKLPYTQEYYNSLFFKNYINPNYFIKSISMFDYDYERYFINNLVSPIFYNIGEYNSNLYEKIIETDINLEYPIIIPTNNSYLFLNLDLVNLIKLINFNGENNYFNKFFKSNEVSLETLVNYLIKFKFKKYNIYKINLFYNSNNVLSSSNIIDPKTNLLNYNYIYDQKKPYIDKMNQLNQQNQPNQQNQTNPINGWINFNNNIMNSIRCKIVFLFMSWGMYSIYGKLFLDNYNIQIYHKKYDIKNQTDKKNLINMLLFLAVVSWGIKIIFYNNKDSEPKVSSGYNYFLATNQYYLFNEINLFKKDNAFDIYFNIIPKNNCDNNQYLKFNINIKLNYYILFLYSDKDSILDNYDELVFNYSQYIFKIFKITNTDSNPNGNLYEHKNLFYIAFQNLKELNIFIGYIGNGIFNIDPTNLLNYFNFDNGVIFCNYYNINKYWVLDKLPPPSVPYADPIVKEKYKIFFSINNLSANQIYLYGNLFIKTL